jgi:micrococcal nuclease
LVFWLSEFFLMGSRRRQSWTPRPLQRQRQLRAVLLAGFALVVVALRLIVWPLPEPQGRPPQTAIVLRAVDGDTLLLEGGERVRLLGVNTPETKHPHKPPEPFGAEASAFTRKHVEGRTIRLEFDRERRDDYGRLLAYVYRDQWFLNEELILAGLSRAQTRFPYSEAMKRRFLAAERTARENGVGLWSVPQK